MRQYVYIFLALSTLLTATCTKPHIVLNKPFPLKAEITQNDTETTITFPSLRRATGSALTGDDIYLGVSTGHGSMADAVLHYSMQTGQAEYLFLSKQKQAAVQGLRANSDWVIWLDGDEHGGGSAVLAMERRTGTIQKVSQDSYAGQALPFLYKHYVAWLQDYTVQLYNLQTNERTTVAAVHEGAAYNALVHMNEDKLVYTDQENGQTIYGLYDLMTKQTQVFPARTQYAGFTQLMQGHLFSMSFASAGSWGGQHFLAYDPATGETQVLPIDSNDDGVSEDLLDFAVTGNRLYAATAETEQLLTYEWRDGALHKLSQTEADLPFQTNQDQQLLVQKDTEVLQISIRD